MLDLTKEFLEAKGYVSSKTNAVYDPEFTAKLAAIPWAQWLDEDKPFRYRLEFLETYVKWIASSRMNSILGLENFPIHHLINGTTQAFDEFYFKYAQRRLRIHRGEYAYHRRVFPNFAFIEDAPLSANDFVIVSVPFCSTGSVPNELSSLFNSCHVLKIPVLVDCAYFGTCAGIHVDLSHEAIEAVCFSLTKGTGLGDIRSGIRFIKTDDELPIAQQNRYDHTVLAAARVGLYMMNHFSPDFIPDKYQKWQIELSERAGLQPTPCMHLALGGEAWSDYKVDQMYSRVGLRELLRARRKGEI